MKKVLLGTSALIAAGIIASPAAAQVELSIGGEIQFMAGVYAEDEDGTNNRETHHRFGTDAQFQFDVSGVSDTGIYYGGRIDIEDDGAQGLGVDEAWVYLSGGFGTVTLGNDDGANDIAGNVPGTGTGIIDGDFGDYITNDPVVFWDTVDSGDAAKIYYRTSGAGGAPGVAALSNNNITVGMSYAPDTDQSLDPAAATRPGNVGNEPSHAHLFEFGAAWSPTFGSVTVSPSAAVTYGVTGFGANQDNFFGGQGNLNIGFGGFTVGAGFTYVGELANNDDQNWGINTGAAYTTGPWTFGAQYAFGLNERVGASDTVSHTFGGGIEYKWLPGLDLEADVVGFTTEDSPVGDNSGVVGLTRVNLSF